MTAVLDGVRDHDRATGLIERLKTALTALGPEDQPLTPQQLGPLDQFHTRGLAASAELAKLARDPARPEVRRQACNLRRRVKQRRAALSAPLGTNAGNELCPDSRRNARCDRTGGFPHADMARRLRGRQGLDRPAARIGAAAFAQWAAS